jgi:hypothetical protein
MLRNVLGVVVGLIAGVIVMMLLEFASGLIHPQPEGFDWQDREAVEKFIKAAPLSATLLVLAAHALGTFAGAWVATKLAGSGTLTQAMIVGAFFLLGGIANLFMIPGNPAWFAVADLGLYLPAAYFAGRLGRAPAAAVAAA